MEKVSKKQRGEICIVTVGDAAWRTKYVLNLRLDVPRCRQNASTFNPINLAIILPFVAWSNILNNGSGLPVETTNRHWDTVIIANNAQQNEWCWSDELNYWHLVLMLLLSPTICWLNAENYDFNSAVLQVKCRSLSFWKLNWMHWSADGEIINSLSCFVCLFCSIYNTKMLLVSANENKTGFTGKPSK